MGCRPSSKCRAATKRRLRRCARKARGFINRVLNKAIDRLPFELHLPGYNFCGPGTKLRKRLNRRDVGMNPLDEACREHDTAYSVSKGDGSARREADRLLAERAWKRVGASDASWGEKAAALGVSGAMKLKAKLGGGLPPYAFTYP